MKLSDLLKITRKLLAFFFIAFFSLFISTSIVSAQVAPGLSNPTPSPTTGINNTSGTIIVSGTIGTGDNTLTDIDSTIGTMYINGSGINNSTTASGFFTVNGNTSIGSTAPIGIGSTAYQPASFSNPSASWSLNSATFQFNYKGPATTFNIDLSKNPDFPANISTTKSSFAQGSSTNIIVNNPWAIWDGYKCGTTIYWRVTNQDRSVKSTVMSRQISCPSFPTTSAVLSRDFAVFNFTTATSMSPSSQFAIDISNQPNFPVGSNTRLNYITGAKKTVPIADPSQILSGYQCNSTVYWKVHTTNYINNPSSSVVKGTVDCSTLAITNNFIAPCNSTSCGSISTAIITGTNFEDNIKVAALGFDGKEYGSDKISPDGAPYSVIAGKIGNHQIIVDYHSLPCGQGYAIKLFYPSPDSRVAFGSIFITRPCTTVAFTNLSAEFSADVINFYFDYSGQSNQFRVNVSKNPDMASDVYTDFVIGPRVNIINQSNLSVPNPLSKWSSYQCGQTYYWRISNFDRTIQSPIQSTLSNCARG